MKTGLFQRLFILLGFSILLICHVAYCKLKSLQSMDWTTSSVQIPIKPLLIDSFGKVYRFPFPLKVQVIWKKDRYFKRPIFRITLQFRHGYIGHFDKLPPGDRVQDDGKVLIADVESLSAPLPLKVEFPDKKISNFDISFLQEQKKSIYFIHDSCTREAISIRAMDRDSKSSLLGAYCEDLKNRIRIYLFHLSEGEITTPVKNVHTYSDKSWTSFEIAKPPDNFPSARPYFYFEFKNKEKLLSQHWIYHVSPFHMSRFTITPGFSITYMSYQEPTRGVSLTEIGLTAKLSANYALIPGKIDVAGNFFGTMLPLSNSTNNALPSAQFFGINIRGGYTLPFQPGGMKWKFWVGEYYWAMVVPNNAYGISTLLGPHILITSQSSPYLAHPFAFYFKYFPIVAPGAPFVFSNMEVAAGGGVQLFVIGRKFPVSATLDLDDIGYVSSDLSDQMSLFSLSLGFQIMF